MLENTKTWPESAASLCPAVCQSDIVNKSGMSGQNIKHVMTQHFVGGGGWGGALLQ